MKLAITDAESFGALNPLEVKAYLVDTGWLEARVLEHRGSYWRHPAYAEVEIPLPFDRKLGDFPDRMRDAVERLAVIEERSPVAVLQDLERAGLDVIRVRLVSSGNDDGSVPLEEGVELMESARNAIYASAWAAASKHRRPYYSSRPPKEVSDFMAAIRQGQTERGSYVVALEAPVAPELAEPELSEQTRSTPEPFSRRVTQTLTSSLQVLRDAANRGNAKEIEEAVNAGVSANLCVAVADALRLAGSQGEVEVRVSWARTRRAPEEAVARVSFPSYLGGVIGEAAGLLRSISEVENFELEGTVYQLNQDTEALILGVVDGRYRKVRVTFPAQFREEMIRGFDARAVIRCVGELRQTGKVTELANARSFAFEDAE